MFERLILLTNARLAEPLIEIARAASTIVVDVALNGEQFDHLSPPHAGRDVLLGFGTGVIVPPYWLTALNGNAYNIHMGTPEFPGRDPHHFAVYRGTTSFGATAHVMQPNVDTGAILDVERLAVTVGMTPSELMRMSEEAGLQLAKRLMPRILKDESHIPPRHDVEWGPVKTRRSDLYRLFQVEPYTDIPEIRRRAAATAYPGRSNLYLDILGERFVHDGPSPQAQVWREKWAEFTESGYATLLDLAARRYRFASFDAPGEAPHVLWRHDIDYSVHRAARLAQIEHERGLSSTYLFGLNMPFYDLRDPNVLCKAKEILALGHNAGLHFDPTVHGLENSAQEALEQCMAAERNTLQSLLDAPVDVVSFHNPTVGDFLDVDKDSLGGMVNVYGPRFRDGYEYCSDSNGYWRFEPLGEVLESGASQRIQVLTHPAWWTPEPMPPRMRIERCVLGRARRVMVDYDALLKKCGRRNAC
jgi:hypothetical protein